MIPADFHFLRPLWLLALVPALVFALAGWRVLRAGREDWRGLVDAHLLRHLAVKGESGGRRWPLALALLGWVLASIAMAGPAWRKLPAPALDRLDPTVMVLSLSRSMDATDQAPSRLTAARHKLDDVLARMRGGQVGLIIYADAPFVAAPLTEDGRVIAQMLPELATDLMPVPADRPDLAIARAVELLQGANARDGRIVLVTDGLGDDPEKTRAAAAAAARAGYRLSVIGVGTVAGSPVMGPNGGMARAPDGAPLLTRMDRARLTQLAADGRGTFTPLTVDGRDLDAVFARALDAGAANPLQDSGMTADQWADMGPYLVVMLLLLAPLAWPAARAGAQDFEAPPAPAPVASTEGARWDDLWRRPDQQGADAFGKGDYAGAAGRFEDPHWRGSALYKAGRFEEAAAAFDGVPGADYNRANALARAGKLEDAVAAYDAALKADATDADALFNRDLVQQLLKRQKDEEQKNQGGGGQQNDPQSGGQNSSSDQSREGKGQQNKNQESKSQDGKNPQQNDGKPDQKAGGSPSQDGKPKDAKSDPAKSNPTKPEPTKPDPAKPDPAKPEPGQSDPAKTKPSTPEPKKPDAADGASGPKPGDRAPDAESPGQAAPPPPQPGSRQALPPQAGRPAGETDEKGEPGAIAARPLTEQDQNSEQALRMVPDDPAGLLRARIRAYYGGSGVAVQDDQN